MLKLYFENIPYMQMQCIDIIGGEGTGIWL